jgi:hypothetical protein
MGLIPFVTPLVWDAALEESVVDSDAAGSLLEAFAFFPRTVVGAGSGSLGAGVGVDEGTAGTAVEVAGLGSGCCAATG